MGWIFLSLVLAAILLAIRFGGRAERTVLAALLISYVGTYLSFHLLGARDWLSVNWGVWLSDAAAFAILCTVALRTKKLWPLPIAGLQLLPMFTPLIALAGQNLVSDGLGRAQGLWAYPQLTLLILASLFRRKLTTRSPY
jgi:predicted anti-sigma-YlaC factor YlaD